MAFDKNLVTIGIDMGGTKIAAAPFVNGELLADEILKEPTPQGDAQEILQIMSRLIKQIQENHDVKAVGISTAGIVSDDGEMLGGCGNIKGWKGTKVKKELEALVSLPVVVENDANCAALAEHMFGAAKEFDPTLLVIVGTGIGGGLIFKDNVWRGANFSGGEIGHIKIADKKARRCTCGAWDCWEAYASGTGLQSTARLYFADPEIDNYKLMELHNKGNETAIEVLNTWHEYLAIGLSSVLNVLDPQVTVLSGGMAQFINYPKLNKKVKDKVVDAMKENINIVEGIFKNDSGMIGGACLANLAITGNSQTLINA